MLQNKTNVINGMIKKYEGWNPKSDKITVSYKMLQGTKKTHEGFNSGRKKIK